MISTATYNRHKWQFATLTGKTGLILSSKYYHERPGANFSARIAAFRESSSRIANSAVLRYCAGKENIQSKESH